MKIEELRRRRELLEEQLAEAQSEREMWEQEIHRIEKKINALNELEEEEGA